MTSFPSRQFKFHVCKPSTVNTNKFVVKKYEEKGPGRGFYFVNYEDDTTLFVLQCPWMRTRSGIKSYSYSDRATPKFSLALFINDEVEKAINEIEGYFVKDYNKVDEKIELDSCIKQAKDDKKPKIIIVKLPMADETKFNVQYTESDNRGLQKSANKVDSIYLKNKITDNTLVRVQMRLNPISQNQDKIRISWRLHRLDVMDEMTPVVD